MYSVHHSDIAIAIRAGVTNKVWGETGSNVKKIDMLTIKKVRGILIFNRISLLPRDIFYSSSESLQLEVAAQQPAAGQPWRTVCGSRRLHPFCSSSIFLLLFWTLSLYLVYLFLILLVPLGEISHGSYRHFINRLLFQIERNDARLAL